MSKLTRTVFDTVKAVSLWGSFVLRVPRYKPRFVENNKTILLLAATLPPGTSGGVYRPAALLRYAGQHGWKIIGVAEKDKGLPTNAGVALLESLPKSTEIVRFRTDLKASWTLLPQVDGGFVRALEMTRATLSTIKRRSPSIVVASGPPFYTFIAGYFVSLAANLPLVLDYRDEWSECPFDFVAKARDNRKWEEICQKKASAVVFTTNSQLEHNLAQFPTLSRSKCHVIENGWDNYFDIVRRQATESDRSIVLSYLGALSEHSLPGKFLDCLSQILTDDRTELVRRLKIKFIGYKSSQALEELNRFPFPQCIEVTPQIPMQEAQSLMRESDALLLFANPKLARYRPGKLYEYIAAQRNIIVYGHDGEAARLVQELETGWFVPESDAERLRTILDLLCSGNAPPRKSEKIKFWIEQNSRERMAERFCRLFGVLAKV